MSASPAGPNGLTPKGLTPNGGPPRVVRKPKAADPLVARKKKPVRPVIRKTEDSSQPPITKPVQPNAQLPPRLPNAPRPHTTWTHAPDGDFVDFPLVTTKRALMDGMRYHIARFAAKKEIDPRDQNEFTRPVTLARRDPRQPVKGSQEDEIMADEVVDSKEQERLEILKAEKEARKLADLAQIAPTGKTASAIAAKKAQAFRHEKTSQVHRLDKTAAQKKESDLRYEEALPWHLEDADNRNIWVGNYEAALSDTNVIFVRMQDKYMMIPLEKWYKFTQKNQFKGFTIEEAEARFNKKDKESRWAMKTQEKQEADNAVLETRRQLGKLYTVKTESTSFKNSSKNEFADADELDFDEDDLFQDDDEQATVEPDKDEDAVESKVRIKRDQLAANVFGQTIEADVDKELLEEEEEEEKRKKLGKGVKKALTKREKSTIYESDSSDPYASSSEDDTSDDEKQAEIDKRKDEEAKNKAKAEAAKATQSGATTGTNTPSGRPKHSEKSKKRPGSPNLSESSGTESTRKKIKKNPRASGSSTPIPGSRPMSPAPSGAGSTTPHLTNSNSTLGASMSDGEAGETSDGGRKKKLKIRIKGSSTSNSRAGSPTNGSRATSPAAPLGPLTAQEIVDAVPSEGLTIGQLSACFSAARVGINRIGDGPGQTPKKAFISLVKENLHFDPKTKLLTRKS